MQGLLLLSLAMVAVRAATVVPPRPSTPDDNGPPDTTSVAPPDIVTNPPDMVSSTDSPTSVTDMPTSVTDMTTSATDTSAPNVTTGAVTSGSSGMVMETTTRGPCQPSMDKIQAVRAYSNMASFSELSENQQILVYELLAAGEACRLNEFITTETAQRIFLLAEDLPLKYVYLFVSFMARNLEAEGVVVPV